MHFLLGGAPALDYSWLVMLLKITVSIFGRTVKRWNLIWKANCKAKHTRDSGVDERFILFIPKTVLRKQPRIFVDGNGGGIR